MIITIEWALTLTGGGLGAGGGLGWYSASTLELPYFIYSKTTASGIR